MPERTVAPAIEAEQVAFRYRGADRPALAGVTLSVSTGACFGLLGPNGAGKSTLMSLLSGERRPQAGRLIVAGFDAGDAGSDLRSAIGLAPQDFAFYPALTTQENLDFFAGVFGLTRPLRRVRLAEAIESCGLGDVLARRAGHLSGGLKRRLNLAIALINRPRVLLLDEPTVGVDAKSRQTVIAAVARLREQGATIVYTTHYLEEVEALCDALAIINEGRIVSQGPIEAYRSAGRDGEIHVKLAGPPSDAARSALAQVGAVWDTALHFRVSTQRTNDAARILALLAAHDLEAAEARYGGRRLEDRYLELVGRPPETSPEIEVPPA